jgi:hypothetical protein
MESVRERVSPAAATAPAFPNPPAGLHSGPGSHPPSPPMASQVALSDSDASGSSVTSRVPIPPLRSQVVAPPGLGLGSRGWDAGAGPSRPAPVAQAADTGGWRTQGPRRRPRAAPRAPNGRRPRLLSAARPPANGASSRVPQVLHGCCYNCGEEGHIASQCENPTLCVRCGGTEHISKDCHKRPRSDSDGPPPRAGGPQLRRTATAGSARQAGGFLPPGPPPPASFSGSDRSWRDVVADGRQAAASAGTEFSAPFAPPSPPPPLLVSRLPRVVPACGCGPPRPLLHDAVGGHGSARGRS